MDPNAMPNGGGGMQPSAPNGQMPMPAPQPQMQGQTPPQQGYPQQMPQGVPGYGQPQMRPQPQKVAPNSTQNTLQIAEIRDGIVIMNDGSFRAVVRLQSINFDLMSAQEREAVELGYQNFLNSLYFDVQISVRSRKVDMRPYLERLGKIRTEQDNMLLGMLMDDYIYYISQLVEQTNIMSKQFTICIPYYSSADAKKVLGETKGLFSGLFGSNSKQQIVIDEASLNKAKDELQNRVQSVLSGLLQLGVQGTPLDTKELIELYYDVYNPDTATRQPLTSFENLAGLVVNKGQGEAKQPQLDGGF